MPVTDTHDIVILSDLHMSAGYDSRTGTFHRNEDFFYDGAFYRFVEHYLDEAKRSSRLLRFVILGDFFDFLQVPLDEETGAGATSSESSVLRLERIGDGHRAVFTALARLIHEGHQIDIVFGNHDVELVWPAVQAKMRKIIVDHAAPEADVADRLRFHPWLLYFPGVLYAEHGQQYDGINSFANLVDPFLPDNDKLIEIPLGSFFVRYMFNYFEQEDPFADNIKPPTKYIGWALRHRPLRGLYLLWKYAQFFVRSLPKRSSLTGSEQENRRNAYAAQKIPRIAESIGLPAETLVAIDQLASRPALSDLRSQLNAIVFRPLIPAAVTLGAAVTVSQGTRKLPNQARWSVRALALAGALAWRERQAFLPATDQRGYLLTAAEKVHELLTLGGHQVPVYVFGHTHAADHARLGSDDDSPHYFNSGTWTPIVPESVNLLAARELLTFVEIKRDPKTGAVVPRLLVWNDDAGRADPHLQFMTTTQTAHPSILNTIKEKAQAAV
jgi:UDP-2,3-diacylglucosamine pyrophosphatase LpxH